MRPETEQNLADLVSACREVLDIAGPDGQIYRSSRRDALAVERLFEIIGEALIRIRDQEPPVFDLISSGPQIIGFRNLLAHGYDQIDPERVVVIIQRWLPELLVDALRVFPEAGADRS